LDLHVRAGLDFGRELAVLAVAVADDVRVRELGGFLEAQVGGGGGPADALGWVILVGVLVDEVAGVAGES
jgi:hypothetical protein